MRDWGRLSALGVLALSGLAAPSEPAAALTGGWMTEKAMRSAFIGQTLDGHYVDGLRWTEKYTPDGRLDYHEQVRKGVGYWYFRDQVFCTFYDPGYGLNGGCWKAIKTSSNCFEFYVAGAADAGSDDEAAPGPRGRWSARAWRQGEPSTCENKPSV